MYNNWFACFCSIPERTLLPQQNPCELQWEMTFTAKNLWAENLWAENLWAVLCRRDWAPQFNQTHKTQQIYLSRRGCSIVKGQMIHREGTRNGDKIPRRGDMRIPAGEVTAGEGIEGGTAAGRGGTTPGIVGIVLEIGETTDETVGIITTGEKEAGNVTVVTVIRVTMTGGRIPEIETTEITTGVIQVKNLMKDLVVREWNHSMEIEVDMILIGLILCPTPLLTGVWSDLILR